VPTTNVFIVSVDENMNNTSMSKNSKKYRLLFKLSIVWFLEKD
jgi:hypothetical protein